MYTVDYLKTLHADYVEWNTDPGSAIWPKDTYNFDFVSDDEFHKRLIITHRKDLCLGDYLIDDRGKNGTSEFAGEWIQFGSEQFPGWDSVLRYLLPNV